MLSFLPQTVRGILAVIIVTVNTGFWFIPIITATIIKIILRNVTCQIILSKVIMQLGLAWIACNKFTISFLHNIRWDVRGIEKLGMQQWYLVISNHQTWADIVILQSVFLNKIPFLKFFIKKELIWVPLLGIAWWALDFPFMKRYSRAFLAQNPHLKGKDLEITREACEKFRNSPISVMNFVEGTRLTPKKQAQQNSPFRHLLRPKAGGIAFVLGAMGDYLSQIVNVTIGYPQGRPSFWNFLCGRITEIQVYVETIPISNDLIGDYFNDSAFQQRFQNWVNAVWREKDDQLDAMLKR